MTIELDKLNCTTYLDAIEAIRRLPRNATYNDFVKDMKQVRYGDGVDVDFQNRNHFFTDFAAVHRYADHFTYAPMPDGTVQMVQKDMNRKEDGGEWVRGLGRREKRWIPFIPKRSKPS